MVKTPENKTKNPPLDADIKAATRYGTADWQKEIKGRLTETRTYVLEAINASPADQSKMLEEAESAYKSGRYLERSRLIILALSTSEKGKKSLSKALDQERQVFLPKKI